MVESDSENENDAMNDDVMAGDTNNHLELAGNADVDMGDFGGARPKRKMDCDRGPVKKARDKTDRKYGNKNSRKEQKKVHKTKKNDLKRNHEKPNEEEWGSERDGGWDCDLGDIPLLPR